MLPSVLNEFKLRLGRRTRRRHGRCLLRKTHRPEDLADGLRLRDDRNQFHPPRTPRTRQYIQTHRAAEKLRPFSTLPATPANWQPGGLLIRLRERNPDRLRAARPLLVRPWKMTRLRKARLDRWPLLLRSRRIRVSRPKRNRASIQGNGRAFGPLVRHRPSRRGAGRTVPPASTAIPRRG